MMSETDGAYRRRRPLSEDMSANVETVQDDGKNCYNNSFG